MLEFEYEFSFISTQAEHLQKTVESCVMTHEREVLWKLNFLQFVEQRGCFWSSVFLSIYLIAAHDLKNKDAHAGAWSKQLPVPSLNLAMANFDSGKAKTVLLFTQVERKCWKTVLQGKKENKNRILMTILLEFLDHANLSLLFLLFSTADIESLWFSLVFTRGEVQIMWIFTKFDQFLFQF